MCSLGKEAVGVEGPPEMRCDSRPISPFPFPLRRAIRSETVTSSSEGTFKLGFDLGTIYSNVC